MYANSSNIQNNSTRWETFFVEPLYTSVKGKDIQWHLLKIN